MIKLLISISVIIGLTGLNLFAHSWLSILSGVTISLIILLVDMLFICSLRAGSTALISRYALLIDERISPEELSYTRFITWCWVFLISSVLIERTLLLFAKIQHLTLPGFISGITMHIVFTLLMSALFIGEFYLRQLIFPARDYGSLFKFIHAIIHIPLYKLRHFNN